MIPQGAMRTSAPRTRTFIIEQSYFHMLEQLAVSRFTWRGLPNGIDQRFIELQLFENSSMPLIFFEDKIRLRYMVTQTSNQGWQNLYYNPTKFTPYGVGYSYHELSAKECVPIWDNMLRYNMWDIMYLYATRLARVDRAIDVNLETSVMPMMIVTSEGQKLTVENMLKQKNEGMPFIVSYNDIDPTQVFQSINTANEYVVDKLLNAKAQIWNEAISLLGIDNSNTEKKERLITDEVEAGSEKTNVFRLGFLKARQQACDQINEMFGGRGILVGVDWANGGNAELGVTDGDN